MTVQPDNIILVGFMATGKSRVGAALADKTGWPLVDADDEIVRRAGKPIERIFAVDGEDAFRQLERQVIAGLCAGRGQIIAAGGGAFVDASNRRMMLGRGLVVCLAAEPETIYRRIVEQDGDAAVRPLLAVDDPLGRIRSLLEERAAAYGEAHYTVKTDGLTPGEVAGEALDCIPKGSFAGLDGRE